MTCQVVPTDVSPLANDRDLLRVVRPVLADVLALSLEELDGRVELLLVELVRILDPEVRLVLAQVQRRVRDVDRVVVRGHLAGLLARVVEHDAPMTSEPG